MKTKKLLSRDNNLAVYYSYLKIYSEVIAESDVSHVPVKYRSNIGLINKLWDNYPILIHAKDLGLCNGVDIGCAVASASVVGSLLGMNVVGIDIDRYDFDDSMPMQKLSNIIPQKGT